MSDDDGDRDLVDRLREQIERDQQSIRLLREAKQKYNARRDGKSDLPPFPIGTPCE